ncbi:MAG: YdbH domain-containing protein [Halioglobus sp.]|nr:YdbH domain-containing protein [Halioglobus sp.]
MSRPRALLFTLLLFLAAAALLLFFGQRNLETLAAAQLKQRLAAFGIHQVTLGSMQIGRRQLTLDSLQLAGDYAGLRYRATLSNTRVRYTAASLRALSLSGVTVGRLELALTRGEPPTEPESATTELRLSDWLSGPINTHLPLTTLSLPAIELSYRHPQSGPFVLTGKLHVSEALALDVSGAVANAHLTAHLALAEGNAQARLSVGDFHADGFLRASLDLTPDNAPGSAQQWQAAFALNTEHAPLHAWLAQASVALDQDELAARLQALALAGSSTLQGSAVLPDALPLDDFAVQRPPPELVINATLNTQLQSLRYADYLQAMSGQVTLALQHAAAQWQATATGHLQGTLDAAGLPLPEATLASLKFDDGLPFSLTLAENTPLSVTLTDSRTGLWQARLQNGTLSLGDKHHRLQAIALDARADAVGSDATAIQLSASLLTLLDGQTLPRLTLTANQQGPLAATDYELSLVDTAQDVVLTLAGEADITTGSGKHTLDVQFVDMAGTSATLSPLLTHFGLIDRPPTLDAGQLRLTSCIDTGSFDTRDWRQRATLAVKEVSGLWNEIAFNGLSVDAAWQGIEAWQTTQPLRLRLASVEPGFRISDIDATISLPRPTPVARPSVVVERFSAKLFGGRVLLDDDSRWDFGARSNHLTLRAENWSLAELVALQQNSSIAAQGQLSGELPLTVTERRIIINNGSLRAEPPGGTIRYQPDAGTESMGSGSSELQLALELLRDFRFEQLRSSVNLDESGQLTLGLALSGRNPSQQAGRPVNFNINLQQNLDPLLQSLRLGDTLVKEFEGGLR